MTPFFGNYLCVMFAVIATAWFFHDIDPHMALALSIAGIGANIALLLSEAWFISMHRIFNPLEYEKQ